MSSRKEENDRLHPKCDARARAGERRGIWIRYAASGVLVVAIVVAAITRTSGTSTSLSTLDLGLEVAQSTGLAVLALAGLGRR